MQKCRICDHKLEAPFLSLGNSPLSNAYLAEEDLGKIESYYPLEIYVCPECYLVQLDEFETAENIFSSNYAYFSSCSESWLLYCKNYVEMMIKKFGFNKNSFVLEIASNDGYLLQYFKQYGISVLGVEPASNTAKVAIQKGIPTDIAFFNIDYANKIKSDKKQPDLIVGNNVLAHNPNLKDFVGGLKIALKPKGIITMEFPHLLQLIKHNQFDTVYHEHFSYFSFYTICRLFNAYGLELFDVDEIPTHGGSLRIYVKHKEDNSRIINDSVQNLLEKEKKAGLLDLNTYSFFAEKVKLTKRKLLEFLMQVKNQDKKIVGYGAPAKGNTLLNYCGIKVDFINYTVDINPHKQNKFLPGTHIPIKHPNSIMKDKPDYVLILPWNIKEEIMEQMKGIRKWGGKFVIPIPKVEVL